MKKKRLLALILTIFVALSCVSIPVFAENVTEVSDFASLQAALESNSDANIKLTENITLTNLIRPGQEVENAITKNLYLNGYTISSTSYFGIDINNNATLNIYGGANASDTTTTGSISCSLIVESGNSTLNVFSGTVSKIQAFETSGSSVNLNIYNGNITDVTINKCNSANIHGGTINKIDVSDGQTVNIDGGFISSLSGSGNFIISGGYFATQPMSSYLKSGYKCISNTETTSTTYPYKVVVDPNYGTAVLDLESSTTDILDKKTIDQNYTLTANGNTTYTDTTKVKVEWTLPTIAATYTSAKVWDPDTMSWVESKTTDTLDEKTATFTFTNYSSVAVGAKVSFEKAIGTASDPYVSNVLTLESILNPDTHEQQYTEAPAGTITYKYTPLNTDFNSLSAGSGIYGTYTVSIVSIKKVSFDMLNVGDAIDAQYVVKGGKVTEPTAPTADGCTFGGWYKDAACTNAWNFETDTVTEDTTLYAKWTGSDSSPGIS